MESKVLCRVSIELQVFMILSKFYYGSASDLNSDLDSDPDLDPGSRGAF
jgi:hypothetical protein